MSAVASAVLPNPPREIGYAEFHWRLVGAEAAARSHSLTTALESAPRSMERDWIQAGYDQFWIEHPGSTIARIA